jgi:transglutaminase-like putative cysteine protease
MSQKRSAWLDARFFAVVGVAFLLVLGLVGWNVGTSGQARGTDVPASPASSSDVRRFSFEYAVEIPADLAPETEGPVTVFLPIAQDATGQVILDFEVESEFVGQIELESDYGNRFWRAEIPARRPKDTTIVVRYDVERSVVRSGDEPGSEEHAKRFLAASERVVVDHPVLEPILEEIRANASRASAVERSRAIYDWVVDNVEYKKVGTGWGNGDTFWACNERYGNCTDFHSLFISLARTEGIPARFEMGFPVPTDRAEGSVAGYHCWVEFWLPDVGWIPVDASEAFKYPEKRELFFGTQPADRIQFTTGRDLRLGPSHLDRALN